MNSETLSSVAASLSAAAAVVTAVIAGVSLSSTARDSRERTRPVIVPELRRSTLSTGTQDLVIKNYGASVAREVTVLFDPPLTGTTDQSKNVYWISKRYEKRIPIWPPGMILSNVYKHPEEDPGSVTVRISYRGPGRQRYGDSFVLDPDVQDKETFSEPSRRNGKELERLINATQAIARATDRRR